MYILISKCSNNLNSNTIDFKIQVIDGKKKNLHPHTNEQERPYKR